MSLLLLYSVYCCFTEEGIGSWELLLLYCCFTAPPGCIPSDHSSNFPLPASRVGGVGHALGGIACVTNARQHTFKILFFTFSVHFLR
jgi:hypothetical protein